jgi:hypothetical protein
VVAAVPRRKREECVFPGDLARQYDAEGPVGHRGRVVAAGPRRKREECVFPGGPCQTI